VIQGSASRLPTAHVRYELVPAGMSVMVSGHEDKPLDHDALERWTRVGFERGEISQGRTLSLPLRMPEL
jgi:hypothetical protein